MGKYETEFKLKCKFRPIQPADPIQTCHRFRLEPGQPFQFDPTTPVVCIPLRHRLVRCLRTAS